VEGERNRRGGELLTNIATASSRKALPSFFFVDETTPTDSD
jgi:hypothetical protein